MGPISRAALAARLAARSAGRSESGSLFRLEDIFFPPQLALARSTGKRKCVRLPRRTGKTTSAAGILLDGVITPPYANQGYITSTLKNAKRLAWPVLKRLNRDYHLGGLTNDSEGVMRFPHLPNEPNIYLGGVANSAEVDKIRGWEGGVKRFIVDETQAIRTSTLENLIDDAIEPALFDYDGELVCYGTPGPVRAGYFYDIDVGKARKGWEHFFWAIHENPHLERKSKKPTAQMLAELRERRGWTEEHPTYIREYLGQWVDDQDALVFKYNADRNDLVALPAERMTYVIGVDLGFEDADAIAVLGWAPHDPTVYLVEEYVQAKQGMTPLMNALQARVAKYHPIRIVMDLGSIGKKAVEDFRPRFALPLEAADKHRKFEHIEILNDAMRTGKFKARAGGPFAEDASIVQWDQDAKAIGEMKIAEDYHSDITDAVLYAFWCCYGYLAKPKPPPPPKEEVATIERIWREQNRSRDPLEALLGLDD